MQKSSKVVLPKVDWAGFQIAGKTRFGDDLNLVGHANDPKFSPFPTQLPTVGQYWLTDWGLVTEAEFRAKVDGKKLILGINCMDRRYALAFYNWMLGESHGRLVIPFFVAAGICQYGHPVRQIGMRQMIQWICDNANVVKIYAGGHLHNCGGLAYIYNVGSVCESLSCLLGDKKEQNFLRDQIELGVDACIPASHLSKTQKVLVTEKRGRPHIMKIY